MKHTTALFLALALLGGLWYTQSLLACNGHEVRASDSVADILDDLSDEPGVSVTTEDYQVPGTDRTGTKTIMQVGDKQVQIYPDADHRLRVTIYQTNGEERTVTFDRWTEWGGEGTMLADVGRFLKEQLDQSDQEETEEFAG